MFFSWAGVKIRNNLNFYKKFSKKNFKIFWEQKSVFPKIGNFFEENIGMFWEDFNNINFSDQMQ